MSLIHLPPELLDQVLSDQGLRKRDLANLARVNKSIYALLLTKIYKDVRLHGTEQHQDQEIFDLFHRTLVATPRLAATIQSLTASAFLPDDEKIMRSRQILEKLTALRKLSLTYYGRGFFDVNFIQKIMPTKPNTAATTLVKLQHITITDPRLSFHEISKLICFPSLERLAVKCDQRQETTQRDVSPSTSRHPSSSSLKSLTLTISTNCNHGLHSVLSVCSALESFICNITQTHNTNDDPISPAGLSRTLVACQETLNTLEFSSSLCDIDESSLELSRFKNVRSLKASSILLFEEDEREDPALRTGLYTRLPLSLESLEILFVTDTFAFKSLDEIEGSHDEAISAEIKVDNVIWLSELAHYRQSLSYVRIEEDAGRSPSMRAHRTAGLHNAPPRVKDAFDLAQIEIDLYLRPSFYPSLEQHSS